MVLVRLWMGEITVSRRRREEALLFAVIADKLGYNVSLSLCRRGLSTVSVRRRDSLDDWACRLRRLGFYVRVRRCRGLEVTVKRR